MTAKITTIQFVVNNDCKNNNKITSIN